MARKFLGAQKFLLYNTGGRGTLFCHNNITRLQLAAIINRVTLISQHSNKVFENEKQLVNIDFKHIFVINKSRPKSNYALTITSHVKVTPLFFFN